MARKRHVVLLLAPLAGIGLWLALPWAFPLPAQLLRPAPATPRLLDRDGRLLQRLNLGDARRRDAVAEDGLQRGLHGAGGG